jgi:hypothetical protein
MLRAYLTGAGYENVDAIIDSLAGQVRSARAFGAGARLGNNRLNRRISELDADCNRAEAEIKRLRRLIGEWAERLDPDAACFRHVRAIVDEMRREAAGGEGTR